MNKKVLILEDEDNIRSFVVINLKRAGYTTVEFALGEEAVAYVRANNDVDIAILDVMLPDINGFEICEIIRAEGRKVPVMFLTAKGDIVDKSIGFKAGADDYLVKPFQPEELLLRLNAHLRRRQREREGAMPDHRAELFRTGDLEIHFGKYDVRLGGEPGALSSREIELLEVLASDAGSVFTRDQILEALWGSKEAADPNSITVMVRKIREKIEDDPSKPRYLVTVWRVGYKLADLR